MQRRCTLSCKWMREGGREEEGEGEGEREGKVRVGVGERVLYMYTTTRCIAYCTV